LSLLLAHLTKMGLLTYLLHGRQEEVMDIRAEVINKLRTAVSQATAGEIHRAVDFLAFAREVRVGKHDLRRKGRILTQQVRGGDR